VIERHPIPAVGAVVIDHDRLLLVRRSKGAYAGAWAVPGGRQRLGETMREAVVREVGEETGLEVEVGEPIWVGDIIDPTDPSRHYTVIDFLATPVGGTLAAGDDAAEVRWVAFDELGDYRLTPTMEELVTVLSTRRGRSDTG